jgi:excisionase family DNA binding protein
MTAEVDDSVAGALPTRHSDVVPLLDAKGAATLLNVPASWVLAEARADRIPHVRLGRYVRFDTAELELWWQGRRRGPWRLRGAAAEAAGRGARSATSGKRAA